MVNFSKEYLSLTDRLQLGRAASSVYGDGVTKYVPFDCSCSVCGEQIPCDWYDWFDGSGESVVFVLFRAFVHGQDSGEDFMFPCVLCGCRWWVLDERELSIPNWFRFKRWYND